MDIKIGDKVRFLNSTGGGIVRAFQGKDRVLVEDSDGFEIPTFIKECVVVSDGTMQVHSNNRPTVSVAEIEKRNCEEQQQVAQVEKVVEVEGGDRLNVFIAFLPIDEKKIQTTGYEAYLINDSNYYLFFNYMSRENNGWVSRAQGKIEPNTKIFLEEFGKEDINQLEKVSVQLIAFKKDRTFALKNPASVQLRLDTSKFYKLHCFVENDYFEENALLCPIVRKDLQEKSLSIDPEELEQAMQSKIRSERRKPQTIVKKKNNDSAVLEVDLHINELLDNTNGLTSSDMLHYQLDKFKEVLNNYSSKKGQKIVFIHGKGDGVLRKAIEKELKTNYKNCYYQDASFREYGFGATMVIIH